MIALRAHGKRVYPYSNGMFIFLVVDEEEVRKIISYAEGKCMLVIETDEGVVIPELRLVLRIEKR